MVRATTQDSSDDSARFARQVAMPALNEGDRLTRGTRLLVELIQGCNHAGVTVITRNGVHTEAATSDVVQRGDQLQYDLDEGPCIDSVATHGSVVSNDIRQDRRWPRWGPLVHRTTGVGSMLSVLLYTHEAELGALNLYGEGPGAFNRVDLGVAESLAAHLAVAIAAHRQIGQLETAIGTRTVIGQAEGILMERYKIDADRAFEVLRRVSQNSNRKLAALATELATTGELPGLQD